MYSLVEKLTAQDQPNQEVSIFLGDSGRFQIFRYLILIVFCTAPDESFQELSCYNQVSA